MLVEVAVVAAMARTGHIGGIRGVGMQSAMRRV